MLTMCMGFCEIFRAMATVHSLQKFVECQTDLLKFPLKSGHVSRRKPSPNLPHIQSPYEKLSTAA